MRTTDLHDLLATVERVRADCHPELDAGFLEAVVQAEQAFPEDDSSAMQAIEEALNRYLASTQSPDEC